MKTVIASAILALATVDAFAQLPGYADMDRDGTVTAAEYRDYAFDRPTRTATASLIPTRSPATTA